MLRLLMEKGFKAILSLTKHYFMKRNTYLIDMPPLLKGKKGF